MKKVKQLMTQILVKKWIKDNKPLLEDYHKLCNELLFFKAKWGIDIGIILKDQKEIKGRELGVGIVEELFDAQKWVNKGN